jgi:hypothetical protein
MSEKVKKMFPRILVKYSSFDAEFHADDEYLITIAYFCSYSQRKCAILKKGEIP